MEEREKGRDREKEKGGRYEVYRKGCFALTLHLMILNFGIKWSDLLKIELKSPLSPNYTHSVGWVSPGDVGCREKGPNGRRQLSEKAFEVRLCCVISSHHGSTWGLRSRAQQLGKL